MQPTRPSEVKAWCQERGFHPNRTLGQNFLIDANIRDAIVASAELVSGTSVLEVGPGLGAVTQALLEAGMRVVAVEKDAHLAAWLREACGAATLMTLVEADMLDLSLDEFLADAKMPEGRRFEACVSNLPYASGTRILLELARHPLGPPRMAVTVQREVAERLAAPAGGRDRGQAGVWVQQDYDVTLVRTVKPTCFWPRPEIDSTLVRLVRHHRLPMDSAMRRAFENLTRHAFMHRRKQMGAVMRLAPPEWGARGEALLTGAGIAPGVRAEELSNQQWTVLARALATSGVEAG